MKKFLFVCALVCLISATFIGSAKIIEVPDASGMMLSILGGSTPAPAGGAWYYADSFGESDFTSTESGVDGLSLGDVITIPSGSATKAGCKINDGSRVGDGIKGFIRNASTQAVLASGSGSTDGSTNGWMDITFGTPYASSGLNVECFCHVEASEDTLYYDVGGNGLYISETYASAPTTDAGTVDTGYAHGCRVWVE